MRFRDSPYLRLFQFTSYRRFWSGFALSTLGDSMARVALVWFVLQETDSARAVGILTLCYTAPILIGGLAAGYLLDRYDRRRVMAVDNAVRGLAMAMVPLLHFLGMLEVWHAYVAAAVFGSLMMISLAGSPSLIPSIIPHDQLTAANAFETLGFSVTSVLGPPLAGVLIALIGAPNVLIIDAASYFAFALALVGVRYLDQPGDVTGSAAPPRGSTSLGDAVRLLRSNQILLTTTLMYMAVNVGFGATRVWLPNPLLSVSSMEMPVSSDYSLGLVRQVKHSAPSSQSGDQSLVAARCVDLPGRISRRAGYPAAAGRSDGACPGGNLPIRRADRPTNDLGTDAQDGDHPGRYARANLRATTDDDAGQSTSGWCIWGFLLTVLGISTMVGLTTVVISGASAVAFRVRALRVAGPPTPSTVVQSDPAVVD